MVGVSGGHPERMMGASDSRLLHDLAGSIGALRHPAPPEASEEQEGEEVWRSGGLRGRQRSSPGAGVFSSSSDIFF